jgi:GMP synthase-like glutamine amidotransferase
MPIRNWDVTVSNPRNGRLPPFFGQRRRGAPTTRGTGVEAVVWEGSGSAWPGVPWGTPVERRLSLLGWRTSLVPWGDPGGAHRGRAGVLHVFTGGLEPVASGTAAMADRLDAVADALSTARSDGCSVLGICLGAQMIAAVAAGLPPEPVPGGGEAGLTLVRGLGRPDLVVPTAHVAQVPERFLALPEVRHLWTNDVTAVQGFGLGRRVVGVQFHPELSAKEARWAARAFRQEFGAPPAWAAAQAVDAVDALRVALRAAGADRLGTSAAPVADDTVPVESLEAV